MVDERIREMLQAGQDNYEQEVPPQPPASNYEVLLQSARFRDSVDTATGAQKLAVDWTWLVLEGEYEGQTIRDMTHPIHSKPICVDMHKKRIAQLGYEVPTDAVDYYELIPAIEAACIRCQVKVTVAGNNGQFRNVTILDVLGTGADAPEDDSAPDEEPPEQDEPDDTTDDTADDTDANELLPAAVALLESYGIDPIDGDDFDATKTQVCEFGWKEEEVSAEELTVLEALGAEIERKPKPKPKPAPAKKAPAKKTAKKKTAKKGKR